MLNTSTPQTKPAVVVRADVAQKILKLMKRTTPKPLKKSEPMESFVERVQRDASQDPLILAPRNLIKPPADLLDATKWAVALHEAGHALVALLTGGGTGGAAIEKLDGGAWRGISYDGSRIEDAFPIVVAGCAAEALGTQAVRFEPESEDYRAAAEMLRADGITEPQAARIIIERTHTVANQLASQWLEAVRAVAEALCKHGFLDGDRIRKIIGNAQQGANLMHKAMPSSGKLRVEQEIRYPSEFDALAYELAALDVRREQATLKKSLDQALADRMPADVVARIELMHGNACAKLAELGVS